MLQPERRKPGTWGCPPESAPWCVFAPSQDLRSTDTKKYRLLIFWSSDLIEYTNWLVFQTISLWNILKMHLAFPKFHTTPSFLDKNFCLLVLPLLIQRAPLLTRPSPYVKPLRQPLQSSATDALYRYWSIKMHLSKVGPNTDVYLQKVKEIMKRMNKLIKEHQMNSSKEKLEPWGF